MNDIASSGEIPGTVHMAARITAFDWQNISAELDNFGYAKLNSLLSSNECQAIVELYRGDDNFRKTINMSRHNFGRGEYKYFSYPLPDMVHQLRTEFYPYLATIAKLWNEQMGLKALFPQVHTEYLLQCHGAGQNRPTPLMLSYGDGDYNCLHQDLYGELVFPLQVAIQLSIPNEDFTGGEFIVTEQRPRMQSRAEVVPLAQGDCVIFPVRQRPVKGKRGYYRVNIRHGVSRISSGHRYTLGIIFHDAQ